MSKIRKYILLQYNAAGRHTWVWVSGLKTGNFLVAHVLNEGAYWGGTTSTYQWGNYISTIVYNLKYSIAVTKLELIDY